MKRKDFNRRYWAALLSADLEEFKRFLNDCKYMHNDAEALLEKDDRFIKGVMAKQILARDDMEGSTKAKAIEIMAELGWKV